MHAAFAKPIPPDPVLAAGSVRVLPVPRCAVHGPMRYEAAGDWWLCHGWDGEGCCAFGAEMDGGFWLTVRPDMNCPPSAHGYRRAVTVSVGA